MEVSNLGISLSYKLCLWVWLIIIYLLQCGMSWESAQNVVSYDN